jgi:pectinesterase
MFATIKLPLTCLLVFAVLTIPSLGARKASAAPTIIKNIEYANVNGVSLKLDVYEPAGAGPFPGLMYIPGGEYWSQDKCQFSKEGRKFAAQGLTTYVIDYRLAPKLKPTAPGSINCPDGSTVNLDLRRGYHYPAPIQDSSSAVDWITAHGAQFKTDTNHISAIGSSSGGNFSYMLGALGEVKVEAGWSGPTELDSSFGNDINQNYIGCSQKACPQTWQDASPITHVTSSSAPAAIYHAARETMPSYMATDYQKALDNGGVTEQTRILDTSLHAIHYEDFIVPGTNGRTVLQDTADFIKAHD